MKLVSLVFPISTLLLILLFYLGCPDPGTAELTSDGRRSINKRDLVLMGLITVIYAFVAFYDLGSNEAPQSFHEFSGGESLVVDLGEVKTVGSFMYYPGPKTGSYTLSYSEDGENWVLAAELSHGSGDVFKWVNAEFKDGVEANTRYLRITARSSQLLGEIAVKDPDGALLPLSGGEELCDEQSVVPQYPYYLNSSYFDEVYHPRTAYEHLNGITPYEVSHPPLGKLIIAVGMKLFGVTPFGWRFCGTLFGVLMLPIVYVFLKKMFGGFIVPACGTAILACDFMHFTQTRIATIDTYAVFFMLLMYLFMYLYVTEGRLRNLALSGIFFGIGAACKWTCIYAGAGLALIWFIYRIDKLKDGEKLRDFFGNCLFCVVFFVIIPCIIYYLSYYPYGLARGMEAPSMFFTKDYASLVWDNQNFMFNYHAYLESEHPYSSRWYEWMLDIRPILYYRQYFTDGSISAFGAFNNPVLSWAGLVAIIMVGYLAFARKDRVSLFILIGYLAQLLPWVIIRRTTFAYHYFQSSVFLVFALCRIFSLMKENTPHWKANIYGLTTLSLILFVMFYPAISGMPINSGILHTLCGWLPSWPF